jgi:rRNA maturation RNase YbeY
MQKVQFYFHEKKADLKDRKRLKLFIEDLFLKEHKVLDGLVYIFCSDEYLLEINRSFLKHDFYTDVVTFDLSETKHAITGEVYISIDRVRDNAKQIKTSNSEELHRVIFHAALHLCGYKDKKPEELKIMRFKENTYLASYFKRSINVS